MASGFQLWSEVMWSFYEEYKSYSYSNPAYSAATGHFTQMIWRETQSVGCAVAASSCWMGNVHVCHYSPVGNVNAAQYFQQNVFPPNP
ncbi:CAP domain-containing protein [Dunaliella salina]|uniref:CAP domain-containing protein n=1 Tax=Dunaliella salina TaxID=3046 RepID=A0ABQ7H8N1_DUNSA|nr:CAP domain-containing protein [Dunaliella salina]|eukprot:KAF5843199.1 CAP domain-containing protein [Dunaliella salina]